MKIFFEFCGGPRDGEILEGCPENSHVADFDVDLATAYFWETSYGRIGEEFYVLSPCAEALGSKNVRGNKLPVEHRYQISNRLDEPNEAWIVAQYAGPVAYTDVPENHKCPWYERLIHLGITEVTSVHRKFPSLPDLP